MEGRRPLRSDKFRYEGELGEAEVTSTTRGSWCTNLYLIPLLLVPKPQRRSTMRPATPSPTHTLQSMIHIMSPFASRYPRLMFLILGFGPRLWIFPSRPERLGSASSTKIFASKFAKSSMRRSKIGNAGSPQDEMQKNTVNFSLE